MPDQLTSTDNIDYTQLRDLLEAGQWKDADEETGQVMRKITNRVTAGWIREEDFAQLPCLELKTINDLWTKYSKGHFGFAVQSRIWESVEDDYLRFGDLVGWRLNYRWQPYSDLKFSLNASVGHLPASPFYKSDGAAIGWAATLTSKLEDCYADDF
ncbi:serine/threonine kinase [Scytonema sp. UIC 10036]|uniref:GUN4 domain-containing protein n=1 Tax=Scytonema sp. UIC 10036 TaxID=2304196 RepID=UPI0012DA1945|nr:GUN4 domain-containing protein [Scytonema sp. UIC 10036]MUG96310.1 serine/threonine kinase [Scytonema sp. UIC 10036]